MRKGKTLLYLIITLFLTGCHSFEYIGNDEFKNIKKNDVVTIQLQDGKCVEKINVQNSTLTEDHLEIVDKDSVRTRYMLKDISEILQRKLDYVATVALLSVPVQIFIGLENLMNGMVGSTHHSQ